MNTQDKRFLHGALLEGAKTGFLPGTDDFPREVEALRLCGVFVWPFGAHKGARTYVVKSSPSGSPLQTGLVLTATRGGGLTGVELSVGLELGLPPLDVDRVFHKADRSSGSSAPRRPHRRRRTPCRWASPRTCPRAPRASAS